MRQAFLLAAPTYFGSKGSFCTELFGRLAEYAPPARWPELTFVDAFLGGGSVSLFAKAQGFREIYANDISDRSRLIAEAFLTNSSTRLQRSDYLYLTQPLPEGAPRRIETEFCPSVFSRRHAQMLDRCLFWARQLQNPTRRALVLILIWHHINDAHCFPTSLGTSNRPFAEALDGVRSWDEINPKRFTDKSLDRLLKPTLSTLEARLTQVNRGVFGGSPVHFRQQDAVAFLRSVPGDIAFLDPPYAGTLRYEKSFALLDELLFGQVTLPPPSDFSSSTEALHALLEAAEHIPTWILTYGNKEIDLDGLLALVRQHAGDRQVTGVAKGYAHLKHVAKREDNQELIIIATP